MTTLEKYIWVVRDRGVYKGEEEIYHDTFRDILIIKG